MMDAQDSFCCKNAIKPLGSSSIRACFDSSWCSLVWDGSDTLWENNLLGFRHEHSLPAPWLPAVLPRERQLTSTAHTQVAQFTKALYELLYDWNQGVFPGYITVLLMTIAFCNFHWARFSKESQCFLVACRALLEAAVNSGGHQGTISM